VQSNVIGFIGVFVRFKTPRRQIQINQTYRELIRY